MIELLSSALPVVSVVVPLAPPQPGVQVVHSHPRRRPVNLLLTDRRAPAVFRAIPVVRVPVDDPLLLPPGLRRMYGIKLLSWKALWNLREIRGDRLSLKVRGQISPSMLKCPEALGANRCLGMSWFRGCFAALTSKKSPTLNRCALTCLLDLCTYRSWFLRKISET